MTLTDLIEEQEIRDEMTAAKTPPTFEDDHAYFDSRPVVVSECHRCRGCGTIATSYALAYSSSPRLATERDAGMLTAAVVGTGEIFECCREAKDLAARARRPVAFMFNDQVVVMQVYDTPDAIARLWWFKAYGETPEQTAARR